VPQLQTFLRDELRQLVQANGLHSYRETDTLVAKDKAELAGDLARLIWRGNVALPRGSQGLLGQPGQPLINERRAPREARGQQYTALRNIHADEKPSDGQPFEIGTDRFVGPDQAAGAQVAEAKRWMQVTGASPSVAYGLTRAGTHVPRGHGCGSETDTDYFWPLASIGRLRVRKRSGGTGTAAKRARAECKEN